MKEYTIKKHTIKKLALIINITLLILLFTSSVMAQGPHDEEPAKVVIGSSFTLEEDELIDGDVVVLGGSFEMETGSEVKGDIVVFGGNVSINGEVQGEIGVIGGNVEIDDNAVVKGSVTVFGGGTLDIDEDAEISGTITEGLDFPFGFGGEGIVVTVPASESSPADSVATISPPDRPDEPETSFEDRPRDRGKNSDNSFIYEVGLFFGDGFKDIFWSLVIGGLSVLLILFFPVHVKTVQQTLSNATPISFVLGIITFVALLALSILLTILLITICLLPIVFVITCIALLIGWTVIGQFIGRQIFTRLNNPTPSPVSVTFLGVTLLVLVSKMPFLDHLPWFGWMFGFVGGLLGFLVSIAGLGAVVLSRFGTQVYHSTMDEMIVTTSSSSSDLNQSIDEAIFESFSIFPDLETDDETDSDTDSDSESDTEDEASDNDDDVSPDLPDDDEEKPE